MLKREPAKLTYENARGRIVTLSGHAWDSRSGKRYFHSSLYGRTWGISERGSISCDYMSIHGLRLKHIGTVQSLTINGKEVA